MNIYNATIEILKARVSNIDKPITSTEKENIYGYTKEIYDTLKELDQDYIKYKPTSKTNQQSRY